MALGTGALAILVLPLLFVLPGVAVVDANIIVFIVVVVVAVVVVVHLRWPLAWAHLVTR